MKNRIFIVMILATMGLVSCSEDIMFDLNKDKNNPTDVAARLIITDIINNSAFSVASGDLALYASVYVEYNVGVWNQMFNAEMRLGEPSSATTYNNVWNSMYSNLWNLQTIIEKCSPEGPEEANNVVLGMAQLLSAYNLAMLTDLMGDVPWTEALQPGIFWTPNLDKQSDIYAVINQFVADGIANLEKPSSVAAIGNQDPLYAGVASRWAKFGYGLQARFAMRMSKVAPNYDAVINAANKSFANASEEARWRVTGVSNPFYRFFTDRDYFGASQSLLDKLEARNDPRADKYFQSYPGAGAIVFAPNGEPAQSQGLYGLSKLNQNAPVYLMSYHELEFLKAEAYARKGDLANARTSLKNAVTAAFTKETVGLTAADADEYFEDVVAPSLSSQSQAIIAVMMQKYLGLFEGESIETYNDIRRLRAMGEGDLIPLANPLKFPLRYSYGAEDVTTNVNVRNAYGDGQYVYTENVWWAGGSR